MDIINRKAVLEAIDAIESEVADGDGFQYEKWRQYFCDLPSADTGSYRLWKLAYERGKAEAEPRWIPFKTRPLTEEEKEDHPEWDCILDCKLPDDGQRILVSINLRGHEAVQQDEFYSDDGSYLDSGYEIGTEATAWMPLPKPWKGESDG